MLEELEELEELLPVLELEELPEVLDEPVSSSSPASIVLKVSP